MTEKHAMKIFRKQNKILIALTGPLMPVKRIVIGAA